MNGARGCGESSTRCWEIATGIRFVCTPARLVGGLVKRKARGASLAVTVQKAIQSLPRKSNEQGRYLLRKSRPTDQLAVVAYGLAIKIRL